MKRFVLSWLVLSGSLLAPAVGSAQQVSCVRGGLQRAVNLYIEAQTKGDTSGLPLANGLGYVENMERIDINTGLIKTPLKIDHHRSLLDEATCQTFTEVIVTDAAKPYVLGTRMRVNHDKIAEIEILWTTTGYWLFNADNYLKYSSAEDWGPIAAEQRDSRETLVAAANAYLDAFLEGKIDQVPWGFPCVRVEGGMYTGKGSPDRQLRSRRAERREHREPPLRRGRSDRLRRRVLHVRRRRPERRQRFAGYAPVPRRERQAALRAHADASPSVGVSRRRRAEPATIGRGRRGQERAVAHAVPAPVSRANPQRRDPLHPADLAAAARQAGWPLRARHGRDRSRPDVRSASKKSLRRWPLALLGRPREEFKRDVRKLKNLGLKLSLDIGYRLTPKGEALLSGFSKHA